ncbi:MAG TPA: serine/threonine-protein kinase, partial [Gemmataceae bacterium]|nr:serine/threonine-protein kinase [Gemmataceae bacterium]
MDSPAGPFSTVASDPVAAKANGAVDLTGQTLGDYQIVRRLGEGGMGQVYLARQISLKRNVALKVLRADLAANTTALARFKAEAEAVAKATHANIVQVYAIHEVNGLHYMALEYVEGRNLRQFLEKKGPPELMLALSIIRQVAGALQRATELGIIHRDIKPENILLTRKGEVKVADFGLSRIFGDTAQPLHLTQSGITMGTPLYMSPEQVEGKPVDPRTDIYSFGVTCYHLLTGQPPFKGTNAFDVAIQHVQKQPVPLAQIRPDLPADLCNLVHRMMAKNPDDRIQTGREIVREVARLRDSIVGTGANGPDANGGTTAHQSYIIQMGPTPANPAFDSTQTQTMPRTSSHHWLPWLAFASVFMALAGGLAYGWWQNRDTQHVNGQPPNTASVPPPAPPGMTAEEKRLLDAIKLMESSHKDSIALEFRIELGLYYLKDRRLNEAEGVFKPLEDSSDKKNEYRHNVGLLGKAMVLAFRDQPKESNDLFAV